MDRDKEDIEEAYVDTLNKLYNVMLNSYILANRSQPEEKKADDTFAIDLVIARKLCNKVLTML